MMDDGGPGGVPLNPIRCLALLLALFSTLAGCRSSPTPPPPPAVVVLPAEPSFLARQRITGTFHGERHRFEAVLQKQGGDLTVIGLTPYGTKAFVLQQKGDELHFENLMPEGRRPPLKPRYLLADIRHSYFQGPAPGSEAVEGWRPCNLGGEWVYQEATDGGRLLSFRSSLEATEQVTVEHRGTIGPEAFPRHVRLENGVFRYELEIETVSYQPLG